MSATLKAVDPQAAAIDALKQIDEYGLIRRGAMVRLFESVFRAAGDMATQNHSTEALDGAWEGLRILASEMVDENEKLQNQLIAVSDVLVGKSGPR